MFLFMVSINMPLLALSNAKLIERLKNFKISPLLEEPQENLFGARIQRTMTLLSTSNEKQRRTVRILFYGQSIVASPWWVWVEKELRERYPYANLIIENRAIGGYMAPLLVRTAEHDLYPFYPDLVIFHVYGGAKTGELERIYRNIRKYTTAEILTFTHHLYATPNRDKGDSNDSKMIEYLAQKYNCELVNIRREWARYLKYYKIARTDFLCDSIHPNSKGCLFMAGLILKHFKFNSLFNSSWYNQVKNYEARRFFEEKTDELQFLGDKWKVKRAFVETSSADSKMEFAFTGNRIDVIAPSSGKFGTAKILIDGKAPSKIPNLYYATRPTKSLGMWWPALNRVSLSKKAVTEDWSLKITKISDDARKFSFDIIGSVTGKDGSGTNQEKFVSNSGIISILPQDFTMFRTFQSAKKKYPVGFEIKWSVKGKFTDIWKPKKLQNTTEENSYVLAQGLKNGKHTIEIIPNGDGKIAIKEIRVYSPPLR